MLAVLAHTRGGDRAGQEELDALSVHGEETETVRGKREGLAVLAVYMRGGDKDGSGTADMDTGRAHSAQTSGHFLPASTWVFQFSFLHFHHSHLSQQWARWNVIQML